MVCLESAILDAPSVLTTSLIDDESNQLVRFIDIDANSGFTDIYQDYWGKSVITTSTSAAKQYNSRSMKQILRNATLSNLTRVEQIANFLFEFIYRTRAFRCYLGGYL